MRMQIFRGVGRENCLEAFVFVFGDEKAQEEDREAMLGGSRLCHSARLSLQVDQNGR